MKVKALVNYQDSFGNVHLINSVLEVHTDDFKPHLHEEVKAKKATKRKVKKTTDAEEVKEELEIQTESED